MSREQIDEVPMICENCGGTVTEDDSMWSSSHRVYRHEYESGCVASLRTQLAAAEERANRWAEKATKYVARLQAAERERDVSATAHKIACGALAESVEQCKALRTRTERAEADAKILDRVQDNLSIMNNSGELSDAAYEKFYEVIPHERWEAWRTTRDGQGA